jgi:thiol-disulfide isomerase/thioredoxin
MFDPEIPEVPLLENGRPDSTFRYLYYKAHFWDNIDFNDDRIIRTPIFHGKLKSFMQSMTVQMPDSINAAADYIIEKARPSKELFKYCIWYVTYTYETSDIMGMDAVFVHMADTYYASHQAFWVDDATQFKITDRANTLRPLLLGKKAPNLIMRDIHGDFRALHDVEAPYIVTIFWDPDCGHCKKAVPVLDSLYKAFLQPQGIEVYAVCAEYELDKWRKYVKEHEFQWINVSDSTYTIPFKKLYDITSTPVIYILDENKNIIAKKISVQQIGEIIENRNKIKLKKNENKAK